MITKRKISRFLSGAMALTLLLATPVYADTIADIVRENGSYISSTGPGSYTTYSSTGITVYNSSETYTEGDVGPGAAATVTSDTGPATSTAQEGSALLTVPDSIALPGISSEAAVLMDVETGQILYSKNADEKLYPASTTKLLTALVAMEQLPADSVVSFSLSSVSGLESGAATVGMSAGDTMSLTDALHAVLIRSACDVAGALAETAAGSQSAFVALMNQKAAELGCTSSHFANPTGLNDPDHYTTAHDMALIARAALSQDTIRSITLEKSYALPAASSRDGITINNTNKFVTGDQSISGYLGGKTGYTSLAGYCLASLLSVGGRQMIAVVLKAGSGSQYTDTLALADYGAGIVSYNGAGSTSTSTSEPGGTFVDDGAGGRKYLLSDGSYLTGQWLDLDGKTYFFDSDSLMCRGWRHFTNGDWYYFASDGSMVTSSWVIQNGKSYYLQANGVMAVSTVIDGKYLVDENGVYYSDVA